MSIKLSLRFLITASFYLLASFLLISCGNKPETQSAADPHDHGSEAAGASFQEGKGIALMEETKQAIGLELAEVAEQTLQPSITLTAQVYRLASETSRRYGQERTGFAYGTTLVSPETAAQLQPGQKFAMGTVWKVDRTQLPVLGQVEVLLELANPDHSLAVGAFIEVQIPLGTASQKVVSIPRSAVLQTSIGTFAFVENAGFLLRTEIKTGAENQEFIAITDGLYEGDTIAVKPVEALYLIELRSTKGGGHCH
jgi:hypothetical protein